MAFPNPDRTSFIDRPFACPLDTVLDLPPPPSVNKTRRVAWAAHAKYREWITTADKMMLGARCRSRNPIKLEPMKGAYEATIIISDKHTKIDLDNGIKAVIDYARRVSLVVDDSPKYLRKLTVEWGDAPQGCRLILKAVA